MVTSRCLAWDGYNQCQQPAMRESEANPFPFCEAHESTLAPAWQFCRHGACATWVPLGDASCAEHGGVNVLGGNHEHARVLDLFFDTDECRVVTGAEVSLYVPEAGEVVEVLELSPSSPWFSDANLIVGKRWSANGRCHRVRDMQFVKSRAWLHLEGRSEHSGCSCIHGARVRPVAETMVKDVPVAAFSAKPYTIFLPCCGLPHQQLGNDAPARCECGVTWIVTTLRTGSKLRVGLQEVTPREYSAPETQEKP